MEQCEWNPKEQRARYVGEVDCGNLAVWSIGEGRNNIHLCDDCAGLRKFSRFRKRTRLKVSK